MPTTCVNTGSADVMTADVMMSTSGQYTVYFAVVPVDALGNAGTAGSTGSDAGADATSSRQTKVEKSITTTQMATKHPVANCQAGHGAPLVESS